MDGQTQTKKGEGRKDSMKTITSENTPVLNIKVEGKLMTI